MRLVPIIVAVAAGLGGAYYFFFHPPVVLKRATSQALGQFAASVASQDREKIKQSLQALVADDAKIHLEVTFVALMRQGGAPAVVQDFTKADFITLVDTTLYSLTAYDYQPELQSFALAEDHKTAAITFTSKQYADGNSYYAGTAVNMRYSADVTCEGTASFTKETPQLSQASCKMELRSVPKPGEAQKMQNNPGAIQQLLQEQR